MAFDLDKIKENLSADKLKGLSANWMATDQNSKLAEWKSGFQDMKAVLEEGKFNLFVKQFVVLLAVFLAVRFVNGKLSDHQAELKDKMAAINIQQTNKEDYLDNKAHLLRLEPLFPDVEKKSDWLPSSLMSLFSKHDLAPKIDGNFTESAQKVYTVVSQPISFQQSFRDLGKLTASMENGDDFIRASEISISKLTDKESLGENAVTIKFNTVFPKEKYAPKLFKDYAAQMEKLKAQQTAAAPVTKTEETK